MSAPQPGPKPKKPIAKRWWFWVIIAVVLLGILSQCSGGGDEAATPATTPAAAPTSAVATPEPAPTTSEPAPPPAPVGIEERLRKDLRDNFTSVDASGDNVSVEFKVADNLTDKLRARGARMDTVKILKAMRETPEVEGKSVTIVGTFDLTDQYGNTEVGRVLMLNYSPDTIAKINPDNASLTETIWEVAERSPKMIHRELDIAI